MSAEIVIVGCGMMTPVGLSTKETAASTRSRTARLTSIEWRDSRFQRFTVGIVPEDGLPPLHSELEKLPLTYRESRMLRLAEPALIEAIKPLPKVTGPIPILVGLPELHTTVPIKEMDFLGRLAVQTGAGLNLANSAAFPRGRASGLIALREAYDRLSQGKASFALVGGVDCQVDLYILGTLDMQKRVRNEVNPDGFAPGEGAGFLLLTTAEQAKQHRLDVLAKVVANAAAKEDGHIYSDKPYKGEGLAAAFESLFKAAPNSPKVGCVYASFNGEHYWAKEFGVAMLRNRERFVESHRMEHPAECFGDLGAAHGPVMLGLAATDIKRACPKTATMVFASSDLGDRCVAILAAGG
jgi:3-oxoacyl-[acyl-carrier-protein] synthase-1